MNVLSALPGFALAFILIFCYEYRIKLIKTKPKNSVHFYVARDKDGDLWLYIGKPFRDNIEFYSDSKKGVYCLTCNIEDYGLRYKDYDYLKWEDGPVEVFLNIED